MVSGNGYDKVEYRRRVQKDFSNEFQCTLCKPHRGENDRGKRHGRWISGEFVPSKPKAKASYRKARR